MLRNQATARLEEAGGAGAAFVGQNLGVGEPGRVVDADVHELPADAAGALRLRRLFWLRRWPVTRWPGAADPAELLDVEVQQPARPLVLVAVGGSGGSSRLRLPSPTLRSTAETVDSAIDNARRSLPLSSATGAARRSPRRAAPASDAEPASAPTNDRPAGRSLGAPPRQPLRRGALADSGGLGRLRQRPPRRDPLDDQPPALRTGPRVSVQLHPVSSLGLVALDTSSLQGGPDEQRG